MMKRCICFGLLAMLLLSGTALADGLATGLPTGQIIGGPVTLYDGIWTNANVIGSLPNGDLVVIWQYAGPMVQVFSLDKGVAGWVALANVRVDQSVPVYPGVVISQNVTLRQSPSTTAKQLARPGNGTVLDILGEENGWYRVRYWDGKGGAPLEGYVRANFVVRNPSFVTATKATYVYAMPSRDAKMVGEVISGTQLVVIGEFGDFWVVNLRSASGFIHKNDIEYDQVAGNG